MNLLSVLLKRLTRSKLSKRIIPWYAGYYQVELGELDRPVRDFPHLESFFTRCLVDGVRPFEPAADVVVSPVDGRLSVVSEISPQDRFVVKGKTYRLSRLVGSEAKAAPFYGGRILIIYLSPADYHRIHLPLAARELEHYRLGGFSWPVNDWGLKWTRGLGTNHRLISRFESLGGEFLMISVGALNVNSIVRLAKDQIDYVKMENYGYFSFGSTIILVFPPDRLDLYSDTPRVVRAGESLGRIIL